MNTALLAGAAAAARTTAAGGALPARVTVAFDGCTVAYGEGCG